MISQHIFEHGFSLATAQALEVWGDANLITPLDPTNPYLEPVDIPVYTGSDEQLIITTAMSATIISGHLNGNTYKNFYVTPGAYGTGIWTITKSGTSTEDRRTISLYTPGDDRHPAQMLYSEIAHFKLLFSGASYWTVDRNAYDGTVSDVCTFDNLDGVGSTNNIVNRMYTNDTGRTTMIYHLCHNNTIQNSRLNSQNRNSRLSDMVGIELNDWNTVNQVYNNKIINNEIRNHNDGIQLVRGTGQDNNFEGTIIDGNHIYITNDIYTDGSGVLNPAGIWSESEDAIDLKACSNNPANPVIITNNYMWGFRRTDRTYHNSNSNGDCIGIHFGVYNVVIEDNVCFDSAEGISSQNNAGVTWSMADSEVNNNILYEVGGFANKLDYSTALCLADGNNNINMQGNTLVNCRHYWLYLSTTYNSTVNLNTIINQETAGIGGTPLDVITTPNDIYTTAEGIAAGYDTDLVFTTDVFTNSPREITLTNVLQS